MRTLLLVDGSNMVMRAAFGGAVPPEEATPIATGLIRRAARQVCASHLVVALDSSEPSWRKAEYPEYKAHRTTDTSAWLREGHEQWTRLGWHVEAHGGYEADDIIATLALRAVANVAVVVLSGDSDLLTLTARSISILKPLNGGQFAAVTEPDVCQRYHVRSAALLTDLKAMTGETGDNIPGVPGIGPSRAAKLLEAYGNLNQIIAAGAEDKCRYSKVVAQHGPHVERWFKLLSLSPDVPILPIKPSNCLFQ
jgi:DNA polymerase-1